MNPNKMSSQMLLELPPVLAHYLEQDRNQWIEAVPRSGKIWLRERQGIFEDIHDLAARRRVLVEYLGMERARALLFRNGFDQGREEAVRRLGEFNKNNRLALQSSTVLGQLQGKFVAHTVRFEFDLDERTLYREMTLKDCFEANALSRPGIIPGLLAIACWETAGYFSGHVSEILGRRALTIETECAAKGDNLCRFTTRFDSEWGEEAAWMRQALEMDSLEQEMAQRDEAVAAAKKAEQRARAALNDLNRRLRSDLMIEGMIGESAAMEPAMHRARQVMTCEAPVLILGEPGTGKETFARAIHLGGARRAKPFVSVDCIGLKGNLLTQELFGYAKDGVPGAARPYAGACQRAHGGTLHLNELASLSLDAQVMLLRTMREGMLYPIGGDDPVKADIRVVAATEQDIPAFVATGSFLNHLYYALSVVTIDMPPLRQRDTDILRLADLFVREFSERYGRSEVTLSKEFKDVLLDCAWPGNIRQLRNVIEHAIIMSATGALDLADLPDDILAARQRKPDDALTREVVEAALRRAKGNRSRAAELLGIGRTSLWRQMKQLGL